MKELSKLRNTKLIQRYLHLTLTKKLDMGVALRMLVYAEFFIEEKTILDIFKENKEEFEEVRLRIKPCPVRLKNKNDGCAY